jgi:hypothetical protein
MQKPALKVTNTVQAAKLGMLWKLQHNSETSKLALPSGLTGLCYF